MDRKEHLVRRPGPQRNTDWAGWCKMVPRMPSTRPETSTGFARKAGRRNQTAAVLALVLLGSASARAQSAQTNTPPPEPKRIVLTFEQRTRVEGLTNPFRLDELGPTRVLAFRTRLQVTVPRIAGPLGAFVELQDSRSTWNDEPFVVPARHINHLDFKQVQLRLGFDRLFGSRASGGTLLGRYTLDLGRRRLSARNGMRNTTNAFDGIQAWLDTGDGSSLLAFFSRPVRLDPYALDRSQGSRLFWGAWLTVRRWRSFQTELYSLRLDESTNTATHRRFTTLGGRLYKAPSPGEPDYETELTWQGGMRGGQDHRAFFAHLEAGFTFRRARARAAVFYDQVSGDRDPEDDRSERFDTLFGARRFEYAPTGIYGPFFRGNIRGPGARLLLSPTPPVEIMIGHRVLWLSEAKDAWVGSGLRDPTGSSGRFLGHHLETRLRWRLRRFLLVEAAWGHFFKGSYLENVPVGPRTPDSDHLTLAVGFGGTLLAR